MKKKKRILKLTLKQPWFDLELSGEKPFELRDYGNAWIESRLFDKNGKAREYDYIEYTNGYGKHRPSFTCKFSGFTNGKFKMNIKYRNGAKLIVWMQNKYMIFNGPVVAKRNIKK